jgi:hypothetical protein
MRALIDDRAGYPLRQNLFELRQILKGSVGHRLNIGKTEYFRAIVLDISVPEFNWEPGRLLKPSYRADTMILRPTSNLNN